jgi:hypothetical protein
MGTTIAKVRRVLVVLMLLGMALLGGCGLPGVKVVDVLIGSWAAGGTIKNTLTYDWDATYTLEAVATTGLSPGCVGRRVMRGRYSAGDGTVSHSGTSGVTGISGCADPAKDVPEKAVSAAEASLQDRSYRYAVEGDLLRLTGGSTTVEFTRAR